MGRVWAAHRLASPTSELFAIKTLLEPSSPGDELERIFVDEARLASLIRHPNVCTVHDSGTDHAIAYLVMEWVDGGTLHDLLAASPHRRIDAAVAAEIVAAACAGLHAAHQLLDADGNPMQVVHRDVSPQNILISSAGQVKISDFGVARAKGQLHRPTRTGELKGKLSYMAPEQLTTRNFDHRVDVFALGCVLYQATTGTRPFGGDEALETMYRLLETNCELPSTIVADYPRQLETIVLTALAKDVDDRYPTAHAFEQALLDFLASCGRRTDDHAIANLVSERLGDAIRSRGQEIELACLALGHASPPFRAATSSPADPVLLVTGELRDGPDPSSPDPDLRSTANRAWQNSLHPRSRAARSHWVDWTIWSLFLLSTLLMIGLLSRGAKSPAPVQTRLEPAQPAAAESNARVRIDIETEPAGARLSLDDEADRPSPQHFDVPRSSERHTVVASLEGYQTTERILTFEQSARVTIQLVPESASAAGISATPRLQKQLRQEPRPLSSVIPTPALPAEPTAPRTRKPKRALDPENPF